MPEGIRRGPCSSLSPARPGLRHQKLVGIVHVGMMVKAAHRGRTADSASAFAFPGMHLNSPASSQGVRVINRMVDGSAG